MPLMLAQPAYFLAISKIYNCRSPASANKRNIFQNYFWCTKLGSSGGTFVLYGTLRCRAVSYGVLQCFTVLCGVLCFTVPYDSARW
jgi:hypothetical protein